MKFDSQKTYFLSGAIGTEIQRRGFSTALPLWSAKVLFENPDLLVDIYREYIRSGADILSTNTFRTQRRTLALAGLENETARINELAVELVHRARILENASRPIYAGACITTLEDCYRPDLIPDDKTCTEEHGDQIHMLAKTNIDFFLLETFNSVREAQIAARLVSCTGKPFMISFTVNETGDILNGDSWDDVIEGIGAYSPLAIMVNCAPPEAVSRALTKLAKTKVRVPLGAYANGSGEAGSDQGWNFDKAGHEATEYAAHCARWRQQGVQVIGGCCGTSPLYTEHYSRV